MKTNKKTKNTSRLRTHVPLFTTSMAVLISMAGVAQGQTAAPEPGSQTPAQKPKAGSTDLAPVVVKAESLSSVDIAQQKLNDVAGATALITGKEVANQKLTNIADIFTYQPGVYVSQSADSGQAPKISIRGSGINKGWSYWYTGVNFLYDGLPLTGPNGTPTNLWNPREYAYTEVLKGSNGLVDNALALGGTINFVQHTGKDASAILARFDAGSFGLYSGQVSTGLVEGKADFYLSVTSFADQNYGDQNAAKSIKFSGNFGYQITPEIENRFFFKLGSSFSEINTGITKDQVLNNPTFGGASKTANSTDLYPADAWIGNKTTIKLDPDSQLVVGETYNHYWNIDGNKSFGSQWWFDDVGLSTQYTRSDTVFDRQSNTTISLVAITDVAANNNIYLGNGTTNLSGELTKPIYATSFRGSTDASLSVSNDLEAIKDFWLTNNITGIYLRRVDDFYANNSGFNPNQTTTQDLSNFDWQGRVGARWDVSKDAQVYANVSRSVEPPRDVDYGAGFGGKVQPRLQDQTATTVELGARGKVGIFEGSATIYRSWLDNELVSVPVFAPNGSVLTTKTSNATPTVHQGLEFALTTTLWKEKGLSIPNNDPKSISLRDNSGELLNPSRLTLRQAYTLSDFSFSDDPVYGHNTLPGVPPQFYQAELRYDHSSGFFAAVNTQISSSYFADYANTLKTNPYALLGAEIGYAPPKGHWETYLEFKNITDQRYASAVSPVYNANGNPNGPAIFYPGNAFGIYGGVAVHF